MDASAGISPMRSACISAFALTFRFLAWVWLVCIRRGSIKYRTQLDWKIDLSIAAEICRTEMHCGCRPSLMPPDMPLTRIFAPSAEAFK